MGSLRAAYAVLLLASCSEPPPPDTICAIPVTVTLMERNWLFPRPPPTIAVGGRIQMSAFCSSGGNENFELDLPYNIDDGGGPAVRATKLGSGVEISGATEGSNQVRIYGDDFDASLQFHARVADQIELVPEEWTLEPPTPWVWTPGVHKFTLPVTGGGETLAGLAVISTFNGTSIQSQVDVATPGDYSIAASAGDLSLDLPFSVADHADSIVMDKADTQLTRSTTPVCFGAYLGDGRRMLGVNWTFSVVNATVQDDSFNCVWLNTTASQAGQIAEVTASGGGLSLTVSVPII